MEGSAIILTSIIAVAFSEIGLVITSSKNQGYDKNLLENVDRIGLSRMPFRLSSKKLTLTDVEPLITC